MPAEDVPAEARHLRLVVDSLASVQAGGPMDWVPPRLRLVTDQRPGSDVNLTPHLVKGLATQQPFERDMPGSVRGELVGVNVCGVHLPQAAACGRGPRGDSTGRVDGDLDRGSPAPQR